GRDLGHRLRELLSRQRWELVHPGGEEETLESEHTGVVQPTELVDIAGYHTAPETGIHIRVSAGRFLLGTQRRGVHRRWQTVERHVDDRGQPARGGGSGGTGKALPVT